MDKPIFGTEEWLAQIMDRINGDEKFNQLAKTFGGKVMFQCDAAPDVHEVLKRDLRLFFVVSGGKVTEWKIIGSGAEEMEADYELSGKYPDWKAVISGKLPLRKAVVLTRKLKLKGKVSELARYMSAWERIFQLMKEAQDEFVYPDEI